MVWALALGKKKRKPPTQTQSFTKGEVLSGVAISVLGKEEIQFH